MNEILKDIRERLTRNEYRNEEHVRLCIVARILESLGWNIWDPTQVDPECCTTPLEDRTKVDFALSARRYTPDVFIEVKRVGHAHAQLDEVERQLRDYNRNQTAPFSVITDGQRWWLYYSQTGGEFRDKRFATIDLLDSKKSIDDVAALFDGYLAKTNIISGHAKQRAEKELHLSQKRRVFLECLQEARRLIQEPPFPALPEVLKSLMTDRGYELGLEETHQLLESLPAQSAASPSVPAIMPSLETKVRLVTPPHQETAAQRSFQAGNPPDLRFTSIDRATLGPDACSSWNELVMAGLRQAYASRGSSVLARLRQVTNANIEVGNRTENGFHPISGTGWSYQNKDANGAWRVAYALAVELRQPITVEFRWRENEGAAFPRQLATMRWSP